MTTRDGSTPSSVKILSCARPTADCTPCVVIAMPVWTDARAAARCTRSSSALTHGLSVPISPMIPGRMPLPPTPSLNSATITAARSSTERRSIERLGRIVGAAIPAGAHDDVQARGAGQPPQATRVAADAVEGQVDEGGAAATAEVAQLIGDEVLVGRELPVVPALLDVPEIDAGVLVREREAELVGRDRSGDGHDARRHRRSSFVSVGRGECGPPTHRSWDGWAHMLPRCSDAVSSDARAAGGAATHLAMERAQGRWLHRSRMR